MTKVEILYFEGCPNVDLAMERVQQALREEGLQADVILVPVTDLERAQSLHFLGSPTIRINGLDVEPAARRGTQFGFVCRTYVNESGREGCPSVEMIRRTLREAASVESADQAPEPSQAAQHASPAPVPTGRGQWLLAAGSIAGAILARLCCIGPVMLLLFGVSLAGAGVFLGARPYLLAIAFSLLAIALYRSYRSAAACQAGETCAPGGLRRQRRMLWAALALVVLLAAFPYYGGALTARLVPRSNAKQESSQSAASLQHAVFRVEGMDCPSCAQLLERTLREIPGVQKAAVSFELKRAELDYDPGRTAMEEIQKTVEAAGYRLLPQERRI